jgi:hypothetical protein
MVYIIMWVGVILTIICGLIWGAEGIGLLFCGVLISLVYPVIITGPLGIFLSYVAARYSTANWYYSKDDTVQVNIYQGFDWFKIITVGVFMGFLPILNWILLGTAMSHWDDFKTSTQKGKVPYETIDIYEWGWVFSDHDTSRD